MRVPLPPVSFASRDTSVQRSTRQAVQGLVAAPPQQTERATPDGNTPADDQRQRTPRDASGSRPTLPRMERMLQWPSGVPLRSPTALSEVLHRSRPLSVYWERR